MSEIRRALTFSPRGMSNETSCGVTCSDHPAYRADRPPDMRGHPGGKNCCRCWIMWLLVRVERAEKNAGSAGRSADAALYVANYGSR